MSTDENTKVRSLKLIPAEVKRTPQQQDYEGETELPQWVTSLFNSSGLSVPYKHLGQRWGSSDLKKSDLFHIILFNLCINGTFLTPEAKWDNEVYLNLKSDTCEFKCWLCVTMSGYTAYVSLDHHHIRKVTTILLPSQNITRIKCGN